MKSNYLSKGQYKDESLRDIVFDMTHRFLSRDILEGIHGLDEMQAHVFETRMHELINQTPKVVRNVGNESYALITSLKNVAIFQGKWSKEFEEDLSRLHMFICAAADGQRVIDQFDFDVPMVKHENVPAAKLGRHTSQALLYKEWRLSKRFTYEEAANYTSAMSGCFYRDFELGNVKANTMIDATIKEDMKHTQTELEI